MTIVPKFLISFGSTLSITLCSFVEVWGSSSVLTVAVKKVVSHVARLLFLQRLSVSLVAWILVDILKPELPSASQPAGMLILDNI